MEHAYTSHITWTGNQGTGTSGYKTYARTWDIAVKGKEPIHCSNDPLLGGDPGKMNPEDLLLSSLSACHMLWYLHLASDAGITVMEYQDSPVATGEVLKGGAGRFISATLRPKITVLPGTDLDAAAAIHQQIHHVCFIARSVIFRSATSLNLLFLTQSNSFLARSSGAQEMWLGYPTSATLRCTPKHPALAVIRLQGNSPRSRLMIAVLFEADALPEAQERYLQLAAGLTPLLSDTPGFIAIERFQSLNSPGKILSLSWWEDEASVANWQQNERHLAAQREGKASIFSYYRIRVARVFRDYSSERGAQPDV